MEPKKSPKADLEGKKAIFFEIGLAVSLLLMILAFSWSQPDITIEVAEVEAPLIEVELVEITREPENVPKPPSPKQSMNVTSELIKVVDDDTVVELDLSSVEFIDDVESVFSGVPNTEGSDGVGWNPDEVFFAVEDMPQFQGGGTAAFAAWVQNNLTYPERARQASIQGTVIVQFIVQADGNIGDINVLVSPSQLLSDAAVAAMRKAPRWTPGKQQGSPVRVSLSIPVQFVLQ